MDDRCEISRCHAKAGLSYLGSGVCAYHWDSLTADNQPVDALTRALGIPAAHAAMTEDPMPETKKTETKSKNAAKAKSAEEAKPKRERKPKEELCVFALRMTEAERTLLHEAAGSGGATRLARAVLIAAANEDEGAFKSAIAEARKLRA